MHVRKDPTKLTLSPTKVDTFFGCRRLFKYRYVSPPPVTIVENKYFLIGNVAHWVLEHLYKDYLLLQTQDKSLSAVAGDIFKQSLAKHNAKKALKKGIIEKSDLYAIKDMIKRYLIHIKDYKNIPTVYSTEKLAKISIGGAVVWLKADRVDQLSDNAYKVVDYKSSGRPASKKDELNSVQIPSYGLWLQSVLGDDISVTGEYIYLRFADRKRGIHTYEITDDMMKEASDKYAFVDQELKNGCSFMQNFKYKYCRSCDFREYCVEDSNDGI